MTISIDCPQGLIDYRLEICFDIKVFLSIVFLIQLIEFLDKEFQDFTFTNFHF